MRYGFLLTIALTLLAGCGEARSVQTSADQQPDAESDTAANTGGKAPNTEADIAAIVEVNSKVLEEIGKISEVMTESADIIMRFNHFTDGHTERVMLCPECYPPPDDSLDTEVEDPEEVIPETLEQLLADAQEFHLSAQRIRSHLGAQQFTLKRHLEKLRAAKEASLSKE